MGPFSRRFVFAAVLLCAIGVAGAVSASTLQDVKARGVIKVAMADFDIVPFVMGPGDRVTGFDMDLATKVAEKLGVKMQIVRLPWANGIDRAWTPGYAWDLFDIACTSITITGARAQVCDFSEWYFKTGQLAMVKKTSPVKTVEDIKGKSIGCLSGSTGMTLVEKKYPESKMLPFETVPDIENGLTMGVVEVGIFDGMTVLDVVRKTPDLRYIDTYLTEENYGVAMKKGSDLKTVIDEVVTANRDAFKAKWIDKK
jgi:polar amino acid transport system substrate-binding protein